MPSTYWIDGMGFIFIYLFHIHLKIKKMRKTPNLLGVFLIGLPTEVIISKEGNISLYCYFITETSIGQLLFLNFLNYF
ncbi:hypothetical protein JOC83_002854 [Bacillus iocasae]|uniref:Uncharacterized protein n=1 Tax=Priestia iocasae TaxID=2291674 RepID=A0ABS2QWZ5_9BACI|nr:hypothetical protein [Metabacillus iocasae]